MLWPGRPLPGWNNNPGKAIKMEIILLSFPQLQVIRTEVAPGAHVERIVFLLADVIVRQKGKHTRPDLR